MSSPTAIRVLRPSPVARWVAYLSALGLSGLGASLSDARVAASGPVLVLFGLSVLCIAFLLAIFLEGLLVRLFSRGVRLEVSSQALTLHQPGGSLLLDLSAPFSCELWRSEGDHKERGGLVRVALSQGGRSLLLLGALPRLEGTAPEETVVAVLARAEEHPFLDFSREEKRAEAGLLPNEGDILQVLAALPLASLPAAHKAPPEEPNAAPAAPETSPA